MTVRIIAAAAIALVLGTSGLAGQDRPRWERGAEATRVAPTLFRATMGLNLPTAVTSGAGEFLFEISHRFVPPISADGAFAGLDGPVRYRLALGYGVTDRVQVGITRSNLNDNLDLGVRARLLELDGPLPLHIAAGGGMAWNHEVSGLVGSSRQFHAWAALNTGLGDRLALGLVPILIQNPLLSVDGEATAFSVGLHGQLHVQQGLSLVGEWTIADTPGVFAHDPASFSVELETGGHFFRVGITNSLRLNPSQHAVGALNPVALDQMRLAFNISRVLAF